MDGNMWVEQTSGTPNLLQGVSFTDANNGTVVGLAGEIIRTTDGGANWVFQSSGTTADRMDAASFTDSSTGTVVGASGTILRTTDAGQTWINQPAERPVNSWRFRLPIQIMVTRLAMMV
jgi:Uncharacterized protein related to plant photosystem II stability/assembly factor